MSDGRGSHSQGILQAGAMEALWLRNPRMQHCDQELLISNNTYDLIMLGHHNYAAWSRRGSTWRHNRMASRERLP